MKQKTKLNPVATTSGIFLLIMGVMCFLIKAASVEYVDQRGILHENFFLLPMGYGFLAAGIVVLAITIIIYLRKQRQAK